MAKKGKEEPTPTINNVPNKDIIQRMNFMYQASAYLQSLQPQDIPESLPVSLPNEPSAVNSQRKGRRKARNGTKKTMGDLARSYVKSMKVVGQRTTVKMDPSIKRAICNGCDSALVPGSTVSTRIEKLASHGSAVVYTCMNCGAKRRIPAPPTFPTGNAAEKAEDASFVELAGLDHKKGRHMQRSKRKKAPLPRQPPLFAREDAGHVTFRGTEKLGAN